MNIDEIQIGSPLYEAALELRYSLFFKEYDLPKKITADDMEAASIHIAITENDELLAYGHLSKLDINEYRVSQIVVNPDYQGQGISKVLLERLMNEAKTRGARKIRLSAQETVIGLYESIGFKQVGELYTVKLTGIPHIKMVYEVDT